LGILSKIWRWFFPKPVRVRVPMTDITKCAYTEAEFAAMPDKW